MLRGFNFLAIFLLSFVLTANASVTRCWTSINRATTDHPLVSETWNWTRNIATNGGTVSFKSIWANDQLVKEINYVGLRSLIQYSLTYSGDFTASFCPIIHDIGSSIAVNHNFVSDDFSESTGLIGNGSSKYIQSGIAQNSLGSTNSYHLAFYNPSTLNTSATLNYAVISAFSDSGGTQRTAFQSASNATPTLQGTLGGTAAVPSIADASSAFWCLSRTASNALYIYKNGSSVAQSLTNQTPSFSSTEIMFFCNYDGTTLARHNPNRFWFMSLGYGLSSTQVANYTTCISNFKTRMGR